MSKVVASEGDAFFKSLSADDSHEFVLRHDRKQVDLVVLHLVDGVLHGLFHIDDNDILGHPVFDKHVCPPFCSMDFKPRKKTLRKKIRVNGMLQV